MSTVEPLATGTSAEDAFRRLQHDFAQRPLADAARVAALSLVASSRHIVGQFDSSITVVDREVHDVDEPMKGDPGNPSALGVWERSWPPADRPQSKKIDARDCFQALDCVACSKSGSVRCARCLGSGKIPHHKRPNETETCSDCRGRGTIQCRHCSGAGTILRFKQIIQSTHTKAIGDKYPQDSQHIPHGKASGVIKLEQPLGYSSESETLAAILGSAQKYSTRGQQDATGSELLREMFLWLSRRLFESQPKSATSTTRLGWLSVEGKWFEGWLLSCRDGTERHSYFVPDTAASIIGPPIRSKRKVGQLSAIVAVGLLALLGGVTWYQRQEAARQLAERQRLSIEATAAAVKHQATAVAALATATQQALVAFATATRQEEEAQLQRQQEAKETAAAIESGRERIATRIAAVEMEIREGRLDDARMVLKSVKKDVAPALEQKALLAESQWLDDLAVQIDRQDEAITASARATDAFKNRCGPEPSVSPWSNMAGAADRWLEDNLNDPGSMDVIGCTPVVYDERLCWVQTCRIRAKNAYGANIVTTWGFSMSSGIDGEEVVVGVEQ